MGKFNGVYLYMGIHFCHNQAIRWTISLKLCMEHYLLIEHKQSRVQCLFAGFHFRAGFGPRNPTEKLTHLVDFLCQLLSLNYVLEIVSGEILP